MKRLMMSTCLTISHVWIKILAEVVPVDDRSDWLVLLRRHRHRRRRAPAHLNCSIQLPRQNPVVQQSNQDDGVQ